MSWCIRLPNSTSSLVEKFPKRPKLLKCRHLVPVFPIQDKLSRCSFTGIEWFTTINESERLQHLYQLACVFISTSDLTTLTMNADS